MVTAIAATREEALYLDSDVAHHIIDRLYPLNKTNNISPKCELSTRELEVLQLIVEGKSNPEIADILYLSLSTVKTNVKSIMNKLAVNDRVQAAVVVLRSGLL